MSEWISTKRKPPKCPCLVVRKNDQRPVIAEHVKKTDVPKDEKWYAFGKFNAIDLINLGRILYEFRITHWMPLPSPPGKEGE